MKNITSKQTVLQRYIDKITGFYQKRTKLCISIILILIVFFGGFIRFYDYFAWLETPKDFTYHGKPQLTNFDGYYFLEQANRILKGQQYNTIEQRYGVIPTYYYPGISVPSEFLAFMYRIFGHFTSLEMFASLMPVIFAPLLVIVMFFIARGIGLSYFPSITFGFFSITTYLYAIRTNLGVYDSDFLNLTLLYMIFLFCIQWVTHPHSRVRQYLFLFLLFITAGILKYWWRGIAEIIFPLTFGLFFIYTSFWWRPQKKEVFIFLGIALSGYLILELYFFVFQSSSFFLYVWKNLIVVSIQKIISYSHATIRKIDILKNIIADNSFYFFEEGKSQYPDRFSKVAELKPTDLKKFIQNYFITNWTFYCSILGLFISPYVLKKRFLLVLPMILFCWILFHSATRFNIYAFPALSLGLSIFFYFILDQSIKRFPHLKPYAYLIVICGILSAVYPSVSRIIEKVHPGTIKKYASSFQAIEKYTPPNALIWTSWDTGYPMIYYTKRYVLADGGTSSGPLLYYAYLPNSLPTQQMAANYTNFLSHRGIHMINTIGSWIFNSLPKSVQTEQFQNDLMRFHKFVFNMTPKEAKSFFHRNLNFQFIDELIKTYYLTDRPHSGIFYINNKIYQKKFYDVNPYLKEHYITIKELFTDSSIDADDIVQFYFEKSHKKNYFMLHYQMTRELGWYLYGSWDMQTKKADSPVYINYHQVKKNNNGDITGTSNLKVSTFQPTRFVIQLFGKSDRYTIEKIVTHHQNHVETKKFGYFFKGLHLEWIPRYQYAVIMSKPVSQVVFSQLYIRNQHIPTKTNPSKNYFQKIAEQPLLFQLWEINADTVPPRSSKK